MTALSVNVNKIALLRNSRGQNIPNVLSFAKQALDLGVRGITVHPRPDERHIRYSDLQALSELVSSYDECEFNIEGYPSDEFLQIVLNIAPHQVTFVPDPPNALTSSFGWDVAKYCDLLSLSIAKLHAHNIRSSLFIDGKFDQFHALVQS